MTSATREGATMSKWREILKRVQIFLIAEGDFYPSDGIDDAEKDCKALAAEVERIEAHDRQTQVLADEKCKWFLARAESAETALAEQRIPCTIPPLPDCDYAPPRKASK